MREKQNKKWKTIQQQVDAPETDFYTLRDCIQFLFSNQQLKFNSDTIASLLFIIYVDANSYRAALFSYRLNILNSDANLLEQRLPMSTVPRESLEAILVPVHEGQQDAADRLSLGIPA